MKPYDPQVGEIWWFENNKKHYIVVGREVPLRSHARYKWHYSLLALEDGSTHYTYYGTMNAYGEGWFKRVA